MPEGRLPSVKIRARGLRRQQTPAEKVFWEIVRKRRIVGLRFLRQHVIAHDGEWTSNRAYVIDFYVSSLRLCIEIDGGVHDDEAQVAYDDARTLALREMGYLLVRFSNEEVFGSKGYIVAELRKSIEKARDFLSAK